MDVETAARTVRQIHLQPTAVHVIQHDGPRATPKVGVAESQGFAGLVAKLPTHNLDKQVYPDSEKWLYAKGEVWTRTDISFSESE